MLRLPSLRTASSLGTTFATGWSPSASRLQPPLWFAVALQVWGLSAAPGPEVRLSLDSWDHTLPEPLVNRASLRALCEQACGGEGPCSRVVSPSRRAAVSPPRAGAGPRWRPDCALRPRTPHPAPGVARLFVLSWGSSTAAGSPERTKDERPLPLGPERHYRGQTILSAGGTWFLLLALLTLPAQGESWFWGTPSVLPCRVRVPQAT